MQEIVEKTEMQLLCEINKKLSDLQKMTHAQIDEKPGLLQQIFSGKNGQISSKRVIGVIGFFFLLLVIVYLLFLKEEIPNQKTVLEMITVIGGITAVLLGAGVLENKK